MDHINDFFSKFKGIFASNLHQKEIIVKVCKKHSNVDLETAKISIKAGVVSVSANPIVKTQIFLNKDKILNQLNQEFGLKIKDIR